MAYTKIKSIVRREVTVDVLWDDGLTATDMVVPDVPVENFDSAKGYLLAYVSGKYAEYRAAADRVAYENPTPDPMVLAAIGHTFDNDGNVVA